MAVRMIAMLALVAMGCASGTSVAVSPVQKVIQLIDEMAVKVQNDLEATEREFGEYAKFCDDEATAKDYAAKASKEQIEALTATVSDADAKIEELEAKIEGLTTKISAAETELAEAVSVRKEAHTDFVATEKEMLESVETLSTATETLKKSLEFMQLAPGSSEREGLDQVLGMLGKIVDANYISNEGRSKVAAFLQAQEDAEDSLTVAAPGGASAVIGTLEEMTAKAENTLADTRQEEMEAAQEYALMKQSMETEISTMKEDLSDATKGKQFNAEAKAGASKELAVEKKGLSEEESLTRELKRGCQERATEFEAEAKDGKAELTALGKAKEILAKKFSSFVQTKVAVKVRVEEDDARARALRRIQEVGQQFHSTALVALAFRASADPFVKVRGMIEEMIAKLLQEAAEEADKKAFCDKEVGESKESKASKEESLEKTQSRLDKASSTVAKLTEAVATLSKEVADIDAAVAEATEVRNAEKAEFKKVEKDLSESEEACAAAISVLREYYEGAALVQVKSRVSSKATGDGSGILGVLEIAESDFAKLLAEARGTEQTSATEYEKMLQENKLLKVTKSMDIKGKKSELKGLETSISEYSEDKESVSTELDAVLQYLDKLKPQCETQVPSYAEIKAKRDAEIQGLKDALDILSGDGVPAFLQTGMQLRGAMRL